MASSTVSNGMSLSRSMARSAAMSTFTSSPPRCRARIRALLLQDLRRLLLDRAGVEQGDLLRGGRGELDLDGRVRDVGVAHLAQPAVDQQGHGLLARRADPTGEDGVAQRRAGLRTDRHQPQVGAPPVPRHGQRPVHTRRGDLQRVRPADEVLVAVECVGGGAAEPGDVVQTRPGVRVDHHPDRVAPARAADIQRVELEPGSGDDGLQQGAQFVRRRPGADPGLRRTILRRPTILRRTIRAGSGRCAPGPGARRGHRRHSWSVRAAGSPSWAVRAGGCGRSRKPPEPGLRVRQGIAPGATSGLAG